MAITNPLNSEAGQVPVPSDPIEIAAAVRASHIMWKAFPYLGFRYGERGRRFGNSDSGYFLTLLGYDQEMINRQIDWMVGLLAPRGMPSFVVEAHLRALYRVLRRTSKPKPSIDTLLCAAERLRDLRRARFSDEEIAAFGARFAARAGFPERRWARGVGSLLACAVADELNGVKVAVEGLEGWFTDRAVFSRAWIDAAKATVRAARRLGGRRA
jgi:hypothetical protein